MTNPDHATTEMPRGVAAIRRYGPARVVLETRQTRNGIRQVWVAKVMTVAFRGEHRSRKGAIADIRPEEERTR